MGKWITNEINQNEINNGNEFVDGDGVKSSDINGIVEGILHNTKKVKELEENDYTLVPKTTFNSEVLRINNEINDRPTTTKVQEMIDQVNAGDIDLTNYYTKEQSKELVKGMLKDKQFKDVLCTHAYEITGKGVNDCNLAIEDQSILIKKIQGQTRRKSLNFFNGTWLKSTDIEGNESTSYNAVLDYVKVSPNTTYTIHYYGNFGSRQIYFYNGNKVYLDVNDFTGGNSTNTFTTPNGCNYIRFSTWTSDNTDLPTDTMLVEGEAYKPYEEYDNTLVNAKADLISTGRNLMPNGNYWKKSYYINDSGTTINSNDFNLYDNFIRVLPNTNYKYSQDENIYTYEFVEFDINKKFLSRSSTYTTSSNTYYIKINTYSSGGSKLPSTYMLNYRNEALPFEPYIEDKMNVGVELGAYDYIENGNIVRQTSNVITLDGSQEGGFHQTEYDRYVLTYSSLGIRGLSGTIVSNLSTTNGGYFFNDDNALLLQIKGLDTLGYDSYDDYLRNNPIQLVMKLETPTIEPITLPTGYNVYKDGAQIQKTYDGYLPYHLTKQYALSLASQVFNNVEIDRQQQAQIDDINKRLNILPNSNSYIYETQILDSLETWVTIEQGSVLANLMFDLHYEDYNIKELIKYMVVSDNHNRDKTIVFRFEGVDKVNDVYYFKGFDLDNIKHLFIKLDYQNNQYMVLVLNT